MAGTGHRIMNPIFLSLYFPITCQVPSFGFLHPEDDKTQIMPVIKAKASQRGALKNMQYNQGIISTSSLFFFFFVHHCDLCMLFTWENTHTRACTDTHTHTHIPHLTPPAPSRENTKSHQPPQSWWMRPTSVILSAEI